jgi:hypothetical protein
MTAWREYLRRVGAHTGFLIFTVAASVAWLLEVMNVYEMKGAAALLMVAGGSLSIAQFMAFRDVRGEREVARQELLKFDADRPQVMVDFSCDHLYNAHHRMLNNRTDRRMVTLVNRGKRDALNVNIDTMEFDINTASFATVPRVEAGGAFDHLPTVLGKDNTMPVYSDHLVYALWHERLGAGVKQKAAGREVDSLTWRMRIVYNDFSGAQYESLCDICYDGADGSVKTVFVRSERLEADA